MRVNAAMYCRVSSSRQKTTGDLARQQDVVKERRRDAQLARLYKRRARLRADAERQVVMVYLYCLHRTGAAHAGWDAVSVDTRGTRGTLARAISHMPKRKDLMDELAAWARDLQAAGLLPSFEAVHPVSPYTSQACDECFDKSGIAARTRKKETAYHEFECTACGTTGNRHVVSARVSALILKRIIEGANAAVT